jgi:hypothetical protein
MSEQEYQSENKWKIVGINILILLTYTLLFRLVSDGIIFDCLFIAIHFLVALMLSLINKKWEWLLSAFVVLAIGFSTCVTFLNT